MSKASRNLTRLFRAVGAEHDPAACDECRAQLPSFVEAEMAGEDAAALYPTVMDHLATCADCDAEYATLLDLLMKDAAGELPEPATYPKAKLPSALRLRRLARKIAQSALAALAPERAQELALAAQTFFEQAARSSERLTLRNAALPMGLGGLDSETLPTLMAAYYSLNTILEKHTADELRALSEIGALENVLRQIARDEAKRYDLRGKIEAAFVDSFVKQALADVPLLLDLASQ